MESLPLDCEARYDPHFLGVAEAAELFRELVGNYEVTNRVMTMADGSRFEGTVGTYIFADPELTSREAFPECWGGRSEWPASLARVRDRIEAVLGVRFPVARCVYYRDGADGMAYHCDPPAYGPTDEIASLSLGAERQLGFRKVSNPDEVHTVTLAPGSLLYMGAHCQERYEHGVPADPGCTLPRLNITFRKYGWGDQKRAGEEPGA